MASSLDQVRSAIIRADQDDVHRVLAVIPNVAIVESIPIGHDCRIAGIDILAETLPVSTAGTYLLTIAVGATNLLVAASFDLETIGTLATLEALALNAVSANLDLSAGEVITITATSNNLDLTGTGLSLAFKTISR